MLRPPQSTGRSEATVSVPSSPPEVPSIEAKDKCWFLLRLLVVPIQSANPRPKASKVTPRSRTGLLGPPLWSTIYGRGALPARRHVLITGGNHNSGSECGFGRDPRDLEVGVGKLNV